MEVVSQRFDNFKKFIKDKAQKENKFITDFMNTPLDYFLATIKTKCTNGVDTSKCMDELFLLAEVKRDDYCTEDVTKALKYMEYFVEICKVIS